MCNSGVGSATVTPSAMQVQGAGKGIAWSFPILFPQLSSYPLIISIINET
jgi:hypothetical protein